MEKGSASVAYRYTNPMNMPHVRLVEHTEQKFVLVEVGQETSEPAIFLWGNPEVTWHKDIVQEILDAGFAVNRILGGGRIQVLPESQVIYVWGKSDRYGEAPSVRVIEILKRAYPSYRIHPQKEPS
jgi:hypothetical protein